MISADFLTWDFFVNNLLAPITMVTLGILLGGAVNHRLRAMLEKEKISPDSPLALFLSSLNDLPRLWGLGAGVYFAVQSVKLPPGPAQMISYLIFSIIVFSIATVVQRTIKKFAERHLSGDTGAASTSLLTNLVTGLVYAAGGIVILDFCGISIAPIVTALGVGGMAIALGLQETMANIFAGLHLLIWKQVRIGDHVRLDSGSEGEVADITWRYTKLHTVSNNVVVIPNSKLASAITTNYDMPADSTRANERVEDVFFTVKVGVSYSSDLDKVERVTLDVARSVLSRLDPSLDIADGSPTAPAVRFFAFGDSSIDFNVNLHTSSFNMQYLVKHEFIKALKNRFDTEGIEIPFPVRTLVNR